MGKCGISLGGKGCVVVLLLWICARVETNHLSTKARASLWFKQPVQA